MTGKRPAKQPSKSPGDGASAQNEESAALPEPHSAPATPQRPSIQDRTSTWGATRTTTTTRTANSTPALTSSSSSQNASSNAKVAIPRQPPNNHAPRYNRRVPRACESCRQRKTKCSGDTPVCRQCRELRINCHYPVGWREKMKKWANRTNSAILVLAKTNTQKNCNRLTNGSEFPIKTGMWTSLMLRFKIMKTSSLHYAVLPSLVRLNGSKACWTRCVCFYFRVLDISAMGC